MPSKQIPHSKIKTNTKTERPPVVVVMGHIDHGKSTLLDYIRKTNVVAKEAGSITQHVAAYEVSHKDPESGQIKRITFIDTPGHEAFRDMRSRGASIADIAILVVSAEEGVKPQTLEVLKTIKETETPFIVAITKIDKPNATVERAKQSLAENEVFVEGFGGNISAVPISGKTGIGIPELLDTILLTAALEEFTGDPTLPASGLVLESSLSPQRGIEAVLVIKNGTLKLGMYVEIGGAITRVRQLEAATGGALKEALFSTPVRLYGLAELPHSGEPFKTFLDKKEAETAAEINKREQKKEKRNSNIKEENTNVVPVVVRADMRGTLEAVLGEISKIEIEGVVADVVDSGVGLITENDIKLAGARPGGIVLGFNVKVEKQALDVAVRQEVTVKTFSIIYELSNFLKETLLLRKPRITTEVSVGRARVIRLFGKTKQKQVVGCSVLEGTLKLDQKLKILRNDYEIGRGTIAEVQIKRLKVKEVPTGEQCGIMVETKTTLALGDILELFDLSESGV